MGGFIAKQPNGKYCRFSTVVDCPTHINMTFENYVEVIMERSYQEWKVREESQDIFDNYIYEFQEVLDRFIPNNMTTRQFNEYKKKMKDPDGVYERT